MRRKKINIIVCERCGRSLTRDDFYWHNKNRADRRSTYCCDCERKEQRDRYDRTQKVPDGLRHDPAYGRCVIKEGQSRKIYWSELKLSSFKEKFPNTLNTDLAIEFGVSRRTIANKAKELGLKKNPVYLNRMHLKNLAKAHLISRCTKRTKSTKQHDNK